MKYFRERELGELPRDREKIGKNAWGGIRALIKSCVEDGSFGATYPENCPDGPIAIGTDAAALRDVMRSHVLGLSLWPWADTAKTPSTPAILSLVEFCWKNVAKPSRRFPHPNLYYQHNHLLEFDVDAGREHFSIEIEAVFRSNRIAYQLTKEGRIERLLDPVQHEALANQFFDTCDTELDDLLNKSKLKFLDLDPEKRREALEHLWDAWEKLRSLDGQGGVSQRAAAMLNRAAGPASPKFNEVLDKEADKLYKIGNQLSIRHRNMNQERIAKSEHVDYLFHRLFSLIQMILRLR